MSNSSPRLRFLFIALLSPIACATTTRVEMDEASFEAKECADIKASADACPLLLGVDSWGDIPEGVRISYADEESTDSMYKLMRCHVAYSRSHADDKMSDCPLYVKGVSIRKGLLSNSIELVSESEPIRAQIRTMMHTLKKPASTGPVSANSM